MPVSTLYADRYILRLGIYLSWYRLEET